MPLRQQRHGRRLVAQGEALGTGHAALAAREAAADADRVLVLAHGRLLHDGPAGDIDEDAFMALVTEAGA